MEVTLQLQVRGRADLWQQLYSLDLIKHFYGRKVEFYGKIF